jgi:integrase/recombinase XerD
MKHLSVYTFSYKQFLLDFEKMIQTKGYSGGKKISYHTDVREFLFFIESKGITDIKKVTATDVISYYEYLGERPNQRREGGLSESTIKRKLYSLRLFFDFLIDTEILDASPARLPKFQFGKYKQRNILSIEEIKQLYGACVTKRDRALVSLAYGCGLRRSEIENLDTIDLQLSKGILAVRNGKNHKNRIIPLSNNVLRDFKEYILYERPSYLKERFSAKKQTAFFLNRKGGARTTGELHADRLKKLIEATQSQTIIKKEITLHCLRHSIATHLLDNGATIEFVRDFLGHCDIDTAHLYSKRRKMLLKIKEQIN